jgi:predicted RNA-binding protein YlxR (DUF448 family)
MRARSQTPERTCLGCMKRESKVLMTRMTMADGVVILDAISQRPGRGGYLHEQADCLERFVRSRVKEFRSLRRAVPLAERRRIADLIRTRLDSKSTVE